MQDNRRWTATAIGVLWLLARIADMSATNRHQISTMHTNKRKRPANRGAPKSYLSITISRRDLGRLGLKDDILGGRYGYRSGLHRFWHDPHKVDLQKPVLQAGALDLDMVGELEVAFETEARSDR